MIQIIRTKDYEEMSRKAANIIAAQITLKKNSVLGLATGSTPVGLYRCLVEGYNKGDLDFPGQKRQPGRVSGPVQRARPELFLFHER